MTMNTPHEPRREMNRLGSEPFGVDDEWRLYGGRTAKLGWPFSWDRMRHHGPTVRQSGERHIVLAYEDEGWQGPADAMSPVSD